MTLFIKKVVYFLFALRGRFILNRKISRIYNSIPLKKTISGENIKRHLSIWKKLGSKPNLKWYKSYASINGNDDPKYITEVDYYNKVELILNNKAFSEAYCDKNFYHKYLDNKLLPQIYLRNIQGVYYTANYEAINSSNEINIYIPVNSEKLIVKKAVDSGGGRGVELFTKLNSIWFNEHKEILTKSYLDHKFGMNFIIQEYIQQHNFYDRFNTSSVNTIRIFTYRSVTTNTIIPLQAVLRIGKSGSIVDNQASGGIACGINKAGRLNNFAINKNGEKIESYNGIVFKNTGKLLKYEEIIALVMKISQEYYYHRLLGFDFSVDSQENIRLIEINNKNNEINFYQMNNGPLFREYTDEIVEFCSKNKVNISFDFEV